MAKLKVETFHPFADRHCGPDPQSRCDRLMGFAETIGFVISKLVKNKSILFTHLSTGKNSIKKFTRQHTEQPDKRKGRNKLLNTKNSLLKKTKGSESEPLVTC